MSKRSFGHIDILGAGEMAIAGAASRIVIADFRAFTRPREARDALPTELAERMEDEHSAADRRALGASRILLKADGSEGELSLYAVPVSQAGVMYALSDVSMAPQVITSLRRGCYSVAQEYRVTAGNRFDIYTYGIVCDIVNEVLITVGDREYRAELGENAYFMYHKSIGRFARVRAITCVLADGTNVSDEFSSPEPGTGS
jgi:hypothetical protein